MPPAKLEQDLGISPNYSYAGPALLSQIHHVMMGLWEARSVKIWIAEWAPLCRHILSKATSLLDWNISIHPVNGTRLASCPSLLYTPKTESIAINFHRGPAWKASSTAFAQSCVVRRSFDTSETSVLVRRGDLQGGLVAGTIPAVICVALLLVIIIRKCTKTRQTNSDDDVAPQPTITQIVEKTDPPELRVITEQKNVYDERGDSPTSTVLRGMYERYSMRHNDPPTVTTTPLPDSPISLTVRPFRPLPQIPIQVQPHKSPAITSTDPKISLQTPHRPHTIIPLPEDGVAVNHPPTSFRDVGTRSSVTYTPTTPKAPHSSRISFCPSVASQSSHKTFQGLKKIIRFSHATYPSEPALSDAASHTLGNLSRQTSMNSLMSHLKGRTSVASSLGTDSDSGTFGSWYRVPHDAPALPALAFLKEDPQGSPLQTLME